MADHAVVVVAALAVMMGTACAGRGRGGDDDDPPPAGDAQVPMDGSMTLSPDAPAPSGDAGGSRPDAGPRPTDCHALLDYLGLDWTPAGASRGIEDPVRLASPVRGVDYRYTESSSATPMLMDCRLAAKVADLSDYLRTFDVVEVVHLGVYNYRCIGGGDPDVDGCTPSQHAFATAIDIHAVRLSSGTEYDLVNDWQIAADPCPSSYQDEGDRILHQIACGAVDMGIFNLVLTPNYNSAHRDHLHCDLTEGASSVQSVAAGVDPPFPGLGH